MAAEPASPASETNSALARTVTGAASPGPAPKGSAPNGPAPKASAPSGPIAPPSDETFDGQYRVKLSSFEGPLDLLLHLIQQHELNILDIPVSFITAKYLEYLKLMQVLSIEIASEYLVMAATLVHIKSKMLLPVAPTGQDDGMPQEEEEDPRAELVRRLLEYQKYKAAAAELAERGTLGRDVFSRGTEEAAAPGPAPFAHIEVFGLLEAFEKVLKRTKVKIDHEVVFDRISITDRILELTEKLQGRRAVRFEHLFLATRDGSAPTRFDLVITFLAMLEMCRMKLLQVYQTAPLAPIYLGLLGGDLELTEAEREEADRDAERLLSEPPAPLPANVPANGGAASLPVANVPQNNQTAFDFVDGEPPSVEPLVEPLAEAPKEEILGVEPAVVEQPPIEVEAFPIVGGPNLPLEPSVGPVAAEPPVFPAQEAPIFAEAEAPVFAEVEAPVGPIATEAPVFSEPNVAEAEPEPLDRAPEPEAPIFAEPEPPSAAGTAPAPTHGAISDAGMVPAPTHGAISDAGTVPAPMHGAISDAGTVPAPTHGAFGASSEPIPVELEAASLSPEPSAGQPETIFGEPETILGEPGPVFSEPEPTVPAPKPIAIIPEGHREHPKDPLITSPAPIAIIPGPIANIPEGHREHPKDPLITTPAPIAIIPEAIAIVPEAVAIIPEAIAIIPEAIAIIPEAVAIIPEAVAIIPEAVAIIPDGFADAFEAFALGGETAQAPQPVAEATQAAAEAPETAPQAPQAAAEAPETAPQAPQAAAEAPETAGAEPAVPDSGSHHEEKDDDG